MDVLRTKATPISPTTADLFSSRASSTDNCTSCEAEATEDSGHRSLDATDIFSDLQHSSQLGGLWRAVLIRTYLACRSSLLLSIRLESLAAAKD